MYHHPFQRSSQGPREVSEPAIDGDGGSEALAYGSKDDLLHEVPETREWEASGRLHDHAMVASLVARLGLPHAQGVYGLLEERVLRVQKIDGHLAWVFGNGPNAFLGTEDNALAYRVDGENWPDTRLPSRTHPGGSREWCACVDAIHRRQNPAWIGLTFGGEDAVAIATAMHGQLCEAGQYPWRPIIIAPSTHAVLPEEVGPEDTLTIFERRGCERAIDRLATETAATVHLLPLPKGARSWADATIKEAVGPFGPNLETFDERDRRPSFLQKTKGRPVAGTTLHHHHHQLFP